MKWAAASLICSLIIQCMPAAADQKTQEAFDAYLDRIYAQWISENPFQVHFYLEHPENYGIELSSYTLMDYSEYDEEAIEAYEKYGFFKGTMLTIWRILRCNPFSKGGYDPVP